MSNITKDAFNKRGRSGSLDMELFEITPIILGGDPVDPNNKTWLSRQQHFEVVRYWNRVIRELRGKVV